MLAWPRVSAASVTAMLSLREQLTAIKATSTKGTSMGISANTGGKVADGKLLPYMRKAALGRRMGL